MPSYDPKENLLTANYESTDKYTLPEKKIYIFFFSFEH
jgi:hypothetical protein